MARNKPADDARRLETATIHEFERLVGQLQGFYNEINTLSKKSPNGPVNGFKLRFINETLKKATALLGDAYRPFPGFETFAEDEMPTTSDVGMMLSQYLGSMGRFKVYHTFKEANGIRVYWHTKDGATIGADGFRD